MDRIKDVIIERTFEDLGTESYSDYLAHAICLAGQCSFIFNGNEFELKEGDLMIVRKGKLIEKVVTSADFEVKVLYVTTSFIELCTPQSNYGMKGSMVLFLNFRWIEYRLNQTDHNFYTELLRNAVQAAILDFFDFHSKLYGECAITTPNAIVMSKFINMLENGSYRKNREVKYYADTLCVTPKYLSEVSKKVTGFAANYWINRYTILDISRLLRDKSLTFVEISDIFGFSSPAYFSRYVQNYLGVNPSEYRE